MAIKQTIKTAISTWDFHVDIQGGGGVMKINESHIALQYTFNYDVE